MLGIEVRLWKAEFYFFFRHFVFYFFIFFIIFFKFFFKIKLCFAVVYVCVRILELRFAVYVLTFGIGLVKRMIDAY